MEPWVRCHGMKANPTGYLLGMGIAKISVSRYIAIQDERIAIRITIFYQFYLREFFKCFRVKEVHKEYTAII